MDYQDFNQKSIQQSARFCREQINQLDWFKKPKTILFQERFDYRQLNLNYLYVNTCLADGLGVKTLEKSYNLNDSTLVNSLSLVEAVLLKFTHFSYILYTSFISSAPKVIIRGTKGCTLSLNFFDKLLKHIADKQPCNMLSVTDGIRVCGRNTISISNP